MSGTSGQVQMSANNFMSGANECRHCKSFECTGATSFVLSTDTSSIVTFAMTVANSCLPAIPVHTWITGGPDEEDGALKHNLMPYFCLQKGIEVAGSLPFLLKTTLDEYHTKASLEYTEVTFDFGTQKKFDQWRVKAKKLGAKLGASDFKKDEKGGDVAMRVGEFMSCLFSPPLDKVVYASMLFMLTCGPLVSFQELFISMQQSIRLLWLEYTIAFTMQNFINTVLKSCLMSYGVQVLIEGHALGDVLQDLLNVLLGLRMHTDVILFHIAGLVSAKAPFLLRHVSLSTTPLITGYRMQQVCCNSPMDAIKAGPST
ncbi:hypothetical protein BKA83DRAFT_4126746 [Pisolithus microcarpus]|nr:hypothetical protein BKA83DRAFT_4126746 [Pisolithus microcarpus]